MPILPSGRRVEFSLDRFHALLRLMDEPQRRAIVSTINDPDDLLFVLDAVHFGVSDGMPFFAGYVACDWTTYAADWNTADRHALQAWLLSPEARAGRAEAMRYIKALVSGRADAPYPYEMAQSDAQFSAYPGSLTRQ